MKKTLSIIYSTQSKPVVMGPKFASSVAGVAERMGYEVDIREITTKNDLERFCQTQPDLVFLGMKYVYDKKTKILSTDILSRYSVPHTNSPDSMQYDLDKELAKQRIITANLATARSIVVKTESDLSLLKTLTPPLFAKPIDAGGAVGIDDLSYNSSYEEARRNLQVKLRTDAAHGGLLVEEFLSGIEYSVGIINISNSTYIGAVVSVGYGENGENFLTSDIKRNKTGRYRLLSNKVERDEVMQFAIDSFRVLGCDGYGRVDIRRDSSGALNFLEVNLIPGLAATGIIMTAFEQDHGFTKDEVIQKIIEYAELRAEAGTVS